MALLISIPVHESADSFADQLDNIATFAPHSLVVSHVSLSSPAGHYEAFHRAAIRSRHAEQVYLFGEIETSPYTVWACHCAAFRFAERIGLNFTHFAMEASNSLFVRDGVEDYVASHQVGLVQYPLTVGHEGRDWVFGERVAADADVRAAVAAGFGTRVNQIEGSFVPRETFAGWMRELDAIGYDHHRISRDWPQEEVWPATLYKAHPPAGPWTYVAFDQPGFEPRCEYINEIASGAVPGKYAVKRVPRNMGHWMRGMIGGITMAELATP